MLPLRSVCTGSYVVRGCHWNAALVCCHWFVLRTMKRLDWDMTWSCVVWNVLSARRFMWQRSAA